MTETRKFLAATDASKTKQFQDAVFYVAEHLTGGKLDNLSLSRQLLFAAVEIIQRDPRMWSYWPQAALVRLHGWRKDFEAEQQRLIPLHTIEQAIAHLDGQHALRDAARAREFSNAIMAAADTALRNGLHRTAIADTLIETAARIQMTEYPTGDFWFDTAEDELKLCASTHDAHWGYMKVRLGEIDEEKKDPTDS